MSWETASLGDVCSIVGGGTPSKSNADYYTGVIPWATVRDMNTEYLSDTDYKITQEAVKESSTNIIPKNNVIIATRVGLGKVCILKHDTAINQDLRGVIPKNKDLVETKYLYYWFKSISKNLIDAGRGATVHGVTLPFVKSLKIPLPPIHIQEKIVTKLDAIFAEIDKATAAAEANIKNAEVLFQSYLTEVFERGGVEWELKKLSEISFEMGRGKSKHRPRNDERLFGGSYPFIQTGDVRNSNMYINSYYQTYNEVGLSQSKLWPAKTVCITIAANIAEIGVLNFDACFPDSLIGIIPDTKKISTEFLYYMLNFAKKIIKSYSKGSAQENINLGTFENMFFKVPSLEIQNTIVQKMNEMKLLTSNILNSQQLKINNLTALKQSILQQAFNGELIKE